MERLRSQDLRALFELLGGAYTIGELDAFPAYVLSALPKLVPCEFSSYNEVNPRRRRISWLVMPPDALIPNMEPIFEQYMGQHPFIARYRRTRDGRPSKFSDFFTRSQFHRLPLYNEFYRRTGVEHQMAFALPSSPPLVIIIGLDRGRQEFDFSERDRLLLNLLRPHLIQAYRNAEAVTLMQQELAQTRQVMEALDRGVVVLTRNGQVRLMTLRARQWLEEYFGNPSWLVNRLPKTLQYWLKQQEALFGKTDNIPPPREPLVFERKGKRLVVRLLFASDERFLLLEEHQTALPPSSLEPLGITRREAEVLRWVALGKTNIEVGRLLALSPRTVQKHLERIYRKLGVETRTAAAAQALALTRHGPP